LGASIFGMVTNITGKAIAKISSMPTAAKLSVIPM
jgi:hypothetical protein